MAYSYAYACQNMPAKILIDRKFFDASQRKFYIWYVGFIHQGTNKSTSVTVGVRAKSFIIWRHVGKKQEPLDWTPTVYQLTNFQCYNKITKRPNLENVSRMFYWASSINMHQI